ncbi:hypothetical protein MPLB_1080054 [Mesorhizobium sp. ORS 3324]|nr:hypothetical protein MPLB_1080054 [Mesorhizobium sp. ORS 3324]
MGRLRGFDGDAARRHRRVLGFLALRRDAGAGLVPSPRQATLTKQLAGFVHRPVTGIA